MSNNSDSWVVAELNPDFLWGHKADFGLDINICAYQLDGDVRNKLFCSLDDNQSVSVNNKISPNIASWDLLLRNELNENKWRFVSNRTEPINIKSFSENIFKSNFISIVILSLLVAGLFGLMKIKKTMIPLEKLVAATRKASKGDFSQVEVEDDSEFSELGIAFNSMSINMKQKISTLEYLSALDRGIAAKLDVNQLINQVIERILAIQPNTAVSIFHISEQTDKEVQCKVNMGTNLNNVDTFSFSRTAIPMSEINALHSHPRGKTITSKNKLSYKKIITESSHEQCWLLPILWQGKMYAFISISMNETQDQDDSYWQECRELAKRVAVAISAQVRETKLMRQAQYDMLTGLPNRILLEDRLNNAIAHSDHTGDPVWVIFIDIDRFKYVNDTLGHDAGDVLLKTISKRLKDSVNESDTVSRFGGDEFIILLEKNIDQDNLTTMTRIMKNIASPIHMQGQNITTTCSAGIAIYPNDNVSAESLIKYADIALYRAKDTGRNNFQFFEQSMNIIATERLKIESLLRSAVEKNEFSLKYQPKLNLKSQKIVGVEALIRWNNPELGAVPPSRFIPIAEETGLINDIGKWALLTACKQAVIWQQAEMGPLLMSVNISTKQLEQENLMEQIETILKQTQLMPKNLELEITESAVLSDINQATTILNKIKSLGIKLAIDDFGTGFSNLSHLDKLPLDTLKIDKIFIDNIQIAEDSVAIVDTVISLAKNMNLKIVAEGVVAAAQIDYLTARQCDEIQGYYISQPVDIKQIENLLIEYNTAALVAIAL